MDFDDVRFCALIMSRYDRLRLLQVPTTVTPVIKDCISQHWYLQLLKQREYYGTTEFKLGGSPWWADGNDAIESRYFISCLVGTLKMHGWEVCGTIDLSRHNNDKSTLLLKQSSPQDVAHMCISFSKTNRIRLIVSSSDISEEAELQLTTRMNETIKQHWVALGPRNYGKSIEWKLEGDPWDTEGLYSDQTRGIYLLCLLLEVIQPLGWRLLSSADIASKNLDANERGYSMYGKPEDLHTWFFIFDESMCQVNVNQMSGDQEFNHHHQHMRSHSTTHEMITGSTSVPNLDSERGLTESPFMGYNSYDGGYPRFGPNPGYGADNSLLQQQNLSRSVPSIAAAAQDMADPFSPNHFQPNNYPYFQQHSQVPMMTPYPPGFIRSSPGSQTSLLQNQPSQLGQTDFKSLPPTNVYRGNENGWGIPRPQSQQYQTKTTCLANGRCQSRQKQLFRQASVGSLPPEHHKRRDSEQHMMYNPYRPYPSFPNEVRLDHGYHSHNQNQDLDGGYKSDSEGYRIEKNSQQQQPIQYRSCLNSPTHHYDPRKYGAQSVASGYIQHQSGSRRNSQARASISFENVSTEKSRSNGFLSDSQNNRLLGNVASTKRLSKSGKFGSQNSSLYKGDVDVQGDRVNGGEDEDRLDSQTPDSADFDEDINQPREDLMINYTMFQTEAKLNSSNQRQTEGSSCEELFDIGNQSMKKSKKIGKISQQSFDANPSRHDSRSNSRQGIQSSTSGERSDSQMGISSKHVESMNIDKDKASTVNKYSTEGYQSEESIQSPRQVQVNAYDSGQASKKKHNRHPKQQDFDLIQVADVEGPPGSVGQPGQGSARTKTNPRGQAMTKRSGSKDRLGGGLGKSGTCSTSKSLNSFERQESNASFNSGQSGHSTHSAPPYHPQQPQKTHAPQSMRPPLQQSRSGEMVPPIHRPQFQEPMQFYQHPAHLQQHHHHHRHCQYGMNAVPSTIPPPSIPCLESCSTQSSSSSASAPPDYDTCSGIPPSYDQALDVPPLMQKNRRYQPDHSMGAYHRAPPTSSLMSNAQNQLQFMQQQPKVNRKMLPRQQSLQGMPNNRYQYGTGTQSEQQRSQQNVRNPSIRSNQLYYMGEFYG